MERTRGFFSASRILIIIFVLSILLGLIFYFTYPLKIRNILPHTENIETISFITITGSNVTDYVLTIEQGAPFDEVIRILDTATYTRKLNTFRGGTGDVIMMIVVYRKEDGEISNYSVDIRELGIMIADEKEYKVKGNTKELIHDLMDWIKGQT